MKGDSKDVQIKLLTSIIARQKRQIQSLRFGADHLRKKILWHEKNFDRLYVMYEKAKGKTRKKLPSEIQESQILRAVRLIEKYMQEGDSISVARKKSCGASGSGLYRAVSIHPAYAPILLAYEKKKGYGNQYTQRAREILANQPK